MSIDAYDLLYSIMTVLVLVTLFVGTFIAAASLRRLGRPAALALLAFVLPILGMLAARGAVAFVRSDTIEPGPKYLALGASNAVHGVLTIASYVMFMVVTFTRRPQASPGERG